MRGLLLKDLYLIMKYCKAYLLIFVVFIAVSAVGEENYFFTFYPCLLAGMIPVTLLGYDERSKWSQYCEALPYTKAQIVSGKYLIGLFAQVAIVVLTALAQGVRMRAGGAFEMRSYLVLLAMLLILSCISSSITLPFMFKFGVEKGRIAYYIMIGVVCGGSVVAASLFRDMGVSVSPAHKLLPVLCLAALALYALSWSLSVVFYQKREV